jgi:protein TonB
VKDKPVSVELSNSALEELRQAVAVEDEVHGFLLGNIVAKGERRNVLVEGVEPFDPGSLKYPPPRLARPGIERVGAYRTQRSGRLTLNHLDAALIESIFTDPGMVYLLVRPPDWRAAFFIQEDGLLYGHASYKEFSLSPQPRIARQSTLRRFLPPAVALLLAIFLVTFLLRPNPAPTSEVDKTELTQSPKAHQASTIPPPTVAIEKPSPTAPAVRPATPRISPPLATPPRINTAVVSIEHIDPNPVKKLMRRVFKKAAFRPARVVRSNAPEAPAGLEQETPVDLKLAIDSSGRVSRVEVVKSAKDPRLTQLASSAADRWRFEPARLGDSPVPSQLVMHFRFRPTP